MNTNIEFLNKNWFRKYPLRATSNYQDVYGSLIPLSLFAGMNLSIYIDYIDLFVSKIVINNNYVNVTISSRTNTNVQAIGYFDGEITTSNQTLDLIPIISSASGHLIIGNKDILSTINGTYILDYNNGKIEDSLIFGYTPPTLTKLTEGADEANGFITFSLENIEDDTVGQTISFSIIDKSLTTPSFFDTVGTLSCTNPIILGINNVYPDENGNIDIFAIEPLMISVSSGIELSINDPDGSIVKSLCTDQLKLPPVDITCDEYKCYRTVSDPERNILTTDTPEFKDEYPPGTPIWT